MLRLQLVEFVSEFLVEQNGRGHLFVGAKYLLAQYVDKLIEAQVDLGLDLVVQVTLAKYGQRIHGRIVVQVKWIEDESLKKREQE